MVSTPFALRSAACCLKLGRWRAEQVGVKAPGTANRATVLPPKSSSVLIGLGPSGPNWVRLADGTLSPTLIVMGAVSWGRDQVTHIDRSGVCANPPHGIGGLKAASAHPIISAWPT